MDDILILIALHVDPEMVLIYTTHHSINALRINNDEFSERSQPSQILNITARGFQITSDVRRNDLFVANWDKNYKGVIKINVNHTGEPEIIVDAGTYHPVGISFDWINGNVYFIDSMWNYIAVCAPRLTQCAKVINEEVPGSSISAMAVHPNAG